MASVVSFMLTALWPTKWNISKTQLKAIPLVGMTNWKKKKRWEGTKQISCDVATNRWMAKSSCNISVGSWWWTGILRYWHVQKVPNENSIIMRAADNLEFIKLQTENSSRVLLHLEKKKHRKRQVLKKTTSNCTREGVRWRRYAKQESLKTVVYRSNYVFYALHCHSNEVFIASISRNLVLHNITTINDSQRQCVNHTITKIFLKVICRLTWKFSSTKLLLPQTAIILFLLKVAASNTITICISTL